MIASAPAPRRAPFLPLLAIVALGLGLGACDKHRPAYALTSTNTIIKFETDEPSKIENEAAVSGLATGDSLVQIDYRPGNSVMYGLTYNSAANTTSIVTVDPDSGLVTALSQEFAPPDAKTLVPPIVMDIDPQNDFMLVIDYAGSASSASATHNFSATFANPSVITNRQATAAPALYYNVNDTNSGDVPELAAIAHNNNVANASGTQLYGLDYTTQSLVTVTTGGELRTINTCGHAFIPGNTGFDIVPGEDQAFAALGGSAENAVFYKVDLSSCSMDRVDEIGGGRLIQSLAVTLKDSTSN